MMMPHPLIPVSLPPASVTMAMSQMNHLSTIANMAAAAQGQSLPSRMVTSVIKVILKTETSQRSNVLTPSLLRRNVSLHTGYLWDLCLFLLLLGLQERVPDSPSPAPSLEDHRRPGSHPSSHRSSSVSSSPAHTESSSDRIRTSLHTLTTQINGAVVLCKYIFLLVFLMSCFVILSLQRHTTMACP